MTGVSTDISASFVKPGGKLGEEVFMESKVVGMGPSFNSSKKNFGSSTTAFTGKTLAYTRTEFRNKVGGLVAFGSTWNMVYITPLPILTLV